jgi:hypothetical protein
LRTSCASSSGAPHALQGDADDEDMAAGGECAARTIHLVSAVEGWGSAAIRSTRPVTPEACAASVSLRLATRSSCRASPQTSSTTTPTASQASASAAVRNALSTSAARTVTSRRGSRPSSLNPLIDTAPDSISVKSCRIHTSGRCGSFVAATRPASPATNPVAAALCRPLSANTSCIAPRARPPRSVASASACPSTTLRGEYASPCASMRSILPRKLASVLARAAHDPPKCERFGDKIMRFSQKRSARPDAKPASTFAGRASAYAAPEKGLGPLFWFRRELEAGLFVHDMF